MGIIANGIKTSMELNTMNAIKSIKYNMNENMNMKELTCGEDLNLGYSNGMMLALYTIPLWTNM